MSPVADNPVIVPDHELEQVIRLDPSGPGIRCPLCGWSPRKEDRWFCSYHWNINTGGASALPAPVD
jgi:hypothetical protein